MQTIPALLLLMLAACGADAAPQAPPEAAQTAEAPAPAFPVPLRKVAQISSAGWSDEVARDASGEATRLIEILDIREGQSIADIGAGSGYFTVRLAPIVGPQGRIYATDIIPDYLNRLKRRVSDAGFKNVSFILGEAGNAGLPSKSVDLAVMLHMYHEIADPFGLLWNLHDSLRPGGRLAIVDVDRGTARHGTPYSLLSCELKAAGYQQLSHQKLGDGIYVAVFQPGARPHPSSIRACTED